MKRCTDDHQVRTAADSGFGGRKGPSSMGKISTAGVLRLRATSAVSRDKSVRRFAQDDDFVGILTKNILNKLALMGLRPGLSSAVPVRQAQGRLCGTHFAISRFSRYLRHG
jgi:hypothetical protein